MQSQTRSMGKADQRKGGLAWRIVKWVMLVGLLLGAIGAAQLIAQLAQG